jgi:predicted transcriptional regulator
MTILTNVSNVLALLASGVALLAAARALQVARRLAQPAQPVTATTQTPPAATSAATGRPAANRRTNPKRGASTPTTSPSTGNAPTTSDSGSRARGDALREQIRAWLAERAGQSLSLVEISNGVGRRSATVAYALDKLIGAGHVELTSPKPRRYAITSDGAQAARSQPALAEAEDSQEPVAPEQPTERAATPAAAKPRARTVAATASVESEPGSAGNGELREQIRAYLASEPGQQFSLIDVAHGVGRASATVNYQLRRLLEAGQVTLASDKPRRYTIPAGQPSQSPYSSPARPSGRRAAKGAAPSSRAARRPASRRGSRKAAAATGKVAAAGK